MKGEQSVIAHELAYGSAQFPVSRDERSIGGGCAVCRSGRCGRRLGRGAGTAGCRVIHSLGIATGFGFRGFRGVALEKALQVGQLGVELEAERKRLPAPFDQVDLQMSTSE